MQKQFADPHRKIKTIVVAVSSLCGILVTVNPLMSISFTVTSLLLMFVYFYDRLTNAQSATNQILNKKY